MLPFDEKVMQSYANNRIAAIMAMFFAYLIHYISVAVAHVAKKEKIDRVAFFEQKMWIYGSLCAISAGVIQGSVFTGLFSWFGLFLIAILHISVFFNDNEKIKMIEKIIFVIFYGVLFVWALGIFVDNLSHSSNFTKVVEI